MIENKITVEVLDNTTNMVIVQLPWRRYPGIVIQGDHLQSLIIMSDEERLCELKRLHGHYCKIAVKK